MPNTMSRSLIDSVSNPCPARFKRRDERRLICEHCRKDFPDVPSMVEHLPCKATHDLVRQGFWDFINGIARNGGPSPAIPR